MSTQTGNAKRSRPQKHKNQTAFKNDLYGVTPSLKKTMAVNTDSLCARCKDVIEWKIKYNKYKCLSQPSKCVKCSERKVKLAYHTACADCALKQFICPKCLQSLPEDHLVRIRAKEEEERRAQEEEERRAQEEGFSDEDDDESDSD